MSDIKRSADKPSTAAILDHCPAARRSAPTAWLYFILIVFFAACGCSRRQCAVKLDSRLISLFRRLMVFSPGRLQARLAVKSGARRESRWRESSEKTLTHRNSEARRRRWWSSSRSRWALISFLLRFGLHEHLRNSDIALFLCTSTPLCSLNELSLLLLNFFFFPPKGKEPETDLLHHSSLLLSHRT